MPRSQFPLSISMHGCAVAVVCGLMLCAGAPVFAQQGQNGGNQSGGGGGLGSGGIGSAGLGGSGSGSGSGGSGGGGVNTGGTGELGGSLAGPELMTFGSDVDVTGGTGFVGRGNTAQNFVGGIVQGQGQTGPGGLGGLGGRGGNNSMFQGLNRQGQFRQGIQQPTGPSRSERVRPRHRIAFETTPRQSEALTTNLQTRLTSLPTAQAGVNVSLNPQGVATLSGTVSDEHSARLAAALARLEPGVRGVNNQLSVAGPQ